MPAKPVSRAAPERHGECNERQQQRDFDAKQNAQHRQPARAQRRAGQPRQRDYQDEFRQRQDFADDAVAAQHQGGAEGDEVSGDVRGEQALQAKEAGGVDKAAVERQ